MSLQFFISHRNDVAVVSFAGEMGLQSLDALDDCRQKIEALPIRHLVINLTEVEKIGSEAIRLLTLIQNNARKTCLDVRVCGLREEILRFLLKNNVIRKNELRGTLVECLQSLDLRQAA